MKKREIRKLTLARETLRHLEEQHLRGVAGATVESICWCITQLCVSQPYTGCVECDS